MNTGTTDPQNELLTEVDEKNNVVGSISRGEAHESPDKIYRTIYVVVKDQEDKVLIQKRSSTKDLYPDCWDLSVGGHVNYGQSYVETAVREVEEELGVTVMEGDLLFIGEVLVKLPQSREFFHVFEYTLRSGRDISPEEKEISDTAWMSIEEIKESIKTKRLKWYPRPIQVVTTLY